MSVAAACGAGGACAAQLPRMPGTQTGPASTSTSGPTGAADLEKWQGAQWTVGAAGNPWTMVTYCHHAGGQGGRGTVTMLHNCGPERLR